MPIFSVSQFTTWHQSFEQDLALYAELGIPGIEVCERKLPDDPDAARRELEKVKQYGLTVTSVQPRCHALFPDGMCPQIKDVPQRMARYRQTIDLIADVFPGEPIALVTITGPAPGFNFRAAHEMARQCYPPLADYAEQRGLRIMLEPLNPILMNVDSFICTLGEAVTMADAVGRANFGIMLDVWHVFRESGIERRIIENGPRIFGVHICDWPKGEPRTYGDRVLPGDGVINLPALLGAAARGGYEGAYCLEIFSFDELEGSLWREDPRKVLRRGRAGFEQAWETRSCD